VRTPDQNPQPISVPHARTFSWRRLISPDCPSCIGTLALLLLVGLVFHSVVGFQFLRWDDDITATRNPLMTRPWSWSLLANLFDAQQALRFKPVHWIVCKVVHSIWGMNPAAWHCIGLTFHALATVLVFIVGRRLFRLTMPENTGLRIDVVTWLAAVLWALHPLRVETVAWVTASTYPMATALLLASFAAYLHSITSTKKIHWLVGSWILAMSAYGTYPITLTYGAFLILFDVCIVKTAPSKLWILTDSRVRSWWLKHLAFSLPAIIALTATIWTRFLFPQFFPPAPNLEALTLIGRVYHAAITAGFLLVRPLGPWDFTSNRYYIDESVLHAPTITLYAMVPLLIGLSAYLLRRQLHHGSAAIAGWLVLSVPCLGLTENFCWPADRYSYLVDVIWSLMIAAVILKLLPTARFILGKMLLLSTAAVTVTLIALCSLITSVTLPTWKDSDRFFTDMSCRDDFFVYWTQAANIYKLWAWHLHESGFPKAASFRMSQGCELYDIEVMKALHTRDLHSAVAIVDARADRGFPMPLILRRERAAWNLELGKLDAAHRELTNVAQLLSWDTRTRSLLADPRFVERRPLNDPP